MSSLMIRHALFAVSIAAVGAMIGGCVTPAAPQPRVAVPMSPNDGGSVKTYAQLRPLRGATIQEMIPPPMFDDAPLVTQAVPEEPAYVNAYNSVGKPRIVVLVNRSLGGTADGYLEPGQYDEAQAKAIDYQAIELMLTDALSANGKVTLLSSSAQTANADVEIRVQARPTKQTAAGLEFRILVEAINTRDNESVARAFVDVPPPLDKARIEKHARFLARKTMAGLANTWVTMTSEPPAPAPQSVTPMAIPPSTRPS